MEASGSVEAIAEYLTERLGTKRAMLAIVLAGEFVTYGGVSLFVAFLRAGADGPRPFQGCQYTATA
jgi:H+/gluconate symporter-like permease